MERGDVEGAISVLESIIDSKLETYFPPSEELRLADLHSSRGCCLEADVLTSPRLRLSRSAGIRVSPAFLATGIRVSVSVFSDQILFLIPFFYSHSMGLCNSIPRKNHPKIEVRVSSPSNNQDEDGIFSRPLAHIWNSSTIFCGGYPINSSKVSFLCFICGKLADWEAIADGGGGNVFLEATSSPFWMIRSRSRLPEGDEGSRSCTKRDVCTVTGLTL